MGGLYYNKAKEQEDDYHDFVQKFLFLLNQIKEKDKSIHTAVASFCILSFLTKYNANFNEDEVYKAVIQDFNNVKEARLELQDKAKKVLNGYIEGGVEAVSIYGSCTEIELRANKYEFKISEFLNSDFCQKNGISGFSTLHSNGKSGMRGFVSEEGIRHYIVTDGLYEMTLNWHDENGKKCTVIINVDANGIELIERNGVTYDQLKANEDVKVGNLFLYQVKFRNKKKGNHKSSEIVTENGNRDINIQTTQEFERGSKETQTSSTKMQDQGTQAIDESLNESINKLEKENTRLTEDKEAISEQLQQKVREVEKLNGKVREKDEALAEVTQKLKQLSDSVESGFEKGRVEKEKLERKAQKEIQKLSKEKAELVKEKQALEEYAEDLDVKVQRLEDQIRELEYELAEAVSENKRLKQELDDTKRELDDQYNQIQRLESQSHELESKKVTELITCLEERKKKIAGLEAQLGEEKKGAYDLRLKSLDLEEKKTQLEEQLRTKTQENIKLEELNKQLEKKETEYFDKVGELEKSFSRERKKSGELKDDISALEEENRSYSEEHKKLLSENSVMEKKIARLKDQLGDQCSLLNQDYMSLVKEMIYLFKENMGGESNVIISKETVPEIFKRFDKLFKDYGVSDQEIEKMLEEVGESKITAEQLQRPKLLTPEKAESPFEEFYASTSKETEKPFEEFFDVSISPMKESNKINTTNLNQSMQKQNERKSPEKEKKWSLKKKNKENSRQGSPNTSFNSVAFRR